ncbi:MarR family winged helix-turn-helix transcriptional regulator [Nannocystis pusilla]|uniref:MarR family winged helix-turn-helix transcriptional regulator n=1 Tax=Nannocystis pusilla TaxID=889268 RepID=UPI003DA2BD80
MTAHDALRLDQQLCFALYRASRAVIRAYGPLLEPLGLTYPQYLVMLVLWEERSASVKALGERLALDSGTLTPLLKRLEQRGLVTRRRDADDERVVRIELTREGQQLRARAAAVPPGLARCAGFDGLDAQGRARLASLRQELVALAERIEAGARDASED